MSRDKLRERAQQWYETHGGNEIAAQMSETDPFGIYQLLAQVRLEEHELACANPVTCKRLIKLRREAGK